MMALCVPPQGQPSSVSTVNYHYKIVKNIDFDGLFSEYGLTYKILNNFDALENQN